MEAIDGMVETRGTHPLLTLVLFGAVIAALVFSGSVVSQQRSEARELEKIVAASAAER